jgi:protoporphyrinogen oxidase
MKIGIIGAGLSGLTCGWYLKKTALTILPFLNPPKKQVEN